MKIFDYLFCDDIRQEMSNKTSLMGVYNDRILIKALNPASIQWPVVIRLCTYVRVLFDQNEDRPNRFSFEFTINGKSIGQPLINAFKTAPESSMASISIIGANIPIDKDQAGHIGIRVTLFRDETIVHRFVQEKALQIVIEGPAPSPIP